ncbi:MAG: hypothetical protein ACRCTD_08050, partial [Beijerinckiaceae bacterium]
MLLFNDKIRTNKAPQNSRQSTYNFIDESAWPACAKFRAAVNSWLSRLDVNERSGLISRLRKGNHFEFQSAILELVVAEALFNLGYKVSIHPPLEGSLNRPDFGFLDEAKNSFFVEVTTNAPAKKAISVSKNARKLRDAIDSLDLPHGSFFNYSLVTSGNSSPKIQPLKNDVIKWIDKPRVAGCSEVGTFSTDEWVIQLELHWKVSDKKFSHSIHLEGPFTKIGDATPSIEQMLEKKSKRYGRNNNFVIVIGDNMNLTWGQDEIYRVLENSLFDATGSNLPGVEKFWGCSSSPRNSHIVAVLFFP